MALLDIVNATKYFGGLPARANVSFGYMPETGRVAASGPAGDLLAREDLRKAYLGI